MENEMTKNRRIVFHASLAGLVCVMAYGLWYAYQANSLMLGSMTILGGVGAGLVLTAIRNEAIHTDTKA